MPKKLVGLIYLGLFLFVTSLDALAEGAVTPALPSFLSSFAPSSEASLKLVITLMVFACIVGFYFLKKANLIGFRANAKSDISLEQQYFISAKERVVVLNVANERYLLGVTQSQINLISRLDDAVDVADANSVEVDLPVQAAVLGKYKVAGNPSI